MPKPDRIIVQEHQDYFIYRWGWIYYAGSHAIAYGNEYRRKASAVRSARRFAKKFANPPDVVVKGRT